MIVMPIVDAMMTGRMTPIILLAVRPFSGHGFVGRRNAQRALDSNSFMCGANPHLSINQTQCRGRGEEERGSI